MAPTILFWSRLERLDRYQETLTAYQKAQDVYYRDVSAGQSQRESQIAFQQKMLESQDRIERMVSEGCANGPH